MKITSYLLSLFLLLLPISSAMADDDRQHRSNEKCPVELVSGMTLDEEFGPDSASITHCLKRRSRVKLVVQANQFCMDNVSNAECTRPYALLNLSKMIDDFEITHDMKPGRDYEMAVIAHTKGGPLMLKDETVNQFRGQVETLIQQGVKFYLCQNATRAMIRNGLLPAGDATINIIDGVEYVTAGITAVTDFQYQGYVYVQP
jgi:intracellular sulfur oxidation DsrE/DsrF family protein